MPHTSVARQASALSMQGPWYPADLLPQLQSTLAALADIELRYHSDQEQLQAWAGPEAIRTRFAAQLEERYQRERNPHVQKLTELQHLMDQIVVRS
ncbi:hypothetical protein [Microvirga sp. VF16]|uniref:hypothetical protein n=1 Tax=Microvirga sp. VF16 TaxID=2807101 RepID=UPI00193DA25D|nr:hypothetical protein [Microvirga sp. VF16]QRM28320.1 hypothetical protein JO965_19060 [Microvirga sp. VF16]